MLHADVWIATASSAVYAPLSLPVGQGDFRHQHTNYQRGKVGGQVNYHYRDIVRVNLHGDYYIWRGTIPVYDRPNWELGLRVDGRIDRNWSLYSDNHFEGYRLALATDGTHWLKPIVEMNVGLQYEMLIGKTDKSSSHTLRPESQPNLVFFAQINNWLHRKNEYLYGYRSQGINFLVGATYRF